MSVRFQRRFCGIAHCASVRLAIPETQACLPPVKKNRRRREESLTCSQIHKKFETRHLVSYKETIF